MHASGLTILFGLGRAGQRRARLVARILALTLHRPQQQAQPSGVDLINESRSLSDAPNSKRVFANQNRSSSVICVSPGPAMWCNAVEPFSKPTSGCTPYSRIKRMHSKYVERLFSDPAPQTIFNWIIWIFSLYTVLIKLSRRNFNRKLS